MQNTEGCTIRRGAREAQAPARASEEAEEQVGDEIVAPRPAPRISTAAFSALVEHTGAELYRFLAGLTGSPEQARDLAQDTFTDAWRAVQRGAAPFTAEATAADDHIRRWLYHAAYCRAVSARRRLRLIRWDSLEAEDLPDMTRLASVASFEDAMAEGDAMRQALERLSREDAACLLLMVVHGFTAAETAYILGATTQVIAKRLSRAKRRLLASYLADEVRTQEGISL
jgi:RNA polymerase sigma-70 factor, ECF subfamily